MIQAVGHRGAAGLVPENTLAGFARAIELGCDAVECDVHLSRDGRLIVMHDDTVGRTTDGAGRIADMTLADIRALDAGGGQKVPVLDEVLAAVRGRCGLFCELKADGTEAPAAEAVVAAGMADEVLLISFGLHRLENLRRRGGFRLGALLGERELKDMDRALAMSVEQIGVYWRSVDAEIVGRASSAGAAVGAWTVNEPTDMRAMIALEVDAITSDRPDLLLDVLKTQGLR